MFDLTKPLALMLAFAFASAAYAQEATGTPPPAEAPVVGDLALGTPEGEADGVGTSYTKETFGDWEIRCIRVAEGTEPCQLYQLLRDEGGNGVVEISMFALPPGEQAVAGASIVTPIATLLTQNVRLKVDNAQTKVYPFMFCIPDSCVSRVAFTAEEVEEFRKGAKATITIVPLQYPDRLVTLDMSLNGFTAGFEAVSKLTTP